MCNACLYYSSFSLCHVLICELWKFDSSSISSLLVPLPISWRSAWYTRYIWRETKINKPICVFPTEALAPRRLNIWPSIARRVEQLCVVCSLFWILLDLHDSYPTLCILNGRFFIYLMMYNSSTMVHHIFPAGICYSLSFAALSCTWNRL